MASSPSASLRLELMATGDQSGTWGDTTNTNLGTLLEQAITGYLSVAQGDVANLTLTTTNYASDQARNAVIRVTGALTATRNVVIQTAAKLYTIANDTTGGFSIVVKTSAGTGVSIPPGAMMNVYSDGTNAVMGQNYWSGSIGGAVYLDAGAAVGPNYDLFRDSTSPAASDILGRVTFNGRDSAANKQEYASIEATILDATSTSEDGTLDFYVTEAGARTKYLSLAAAATAFTGALLYSFDAAVRPSANDAAALGASGTAWADAFFASGGVIDWAAGNTTLTQSTGNLALAGSATDVVLDLSAANAGQIVFPATQNQSANANTLDDYQEGTFTPALQFGGAAVGMTYSNQTGVFTKVGNRYDFTITLTLSAKGSSTGAAQITGMPFSVSSTSAFPCSPSAVTGLTFTMVVQVTGTTLLLRQGSATGIANLTEANCTDTSSFNISGTCFTAA